ncbi:MAG: lectin [Acidobacteria bacterium]|nr:lectin [Acidobacteriota bacterium]
MRNRNLVVAVMVLVGTGSYLLLAQTPPAQPQPPMTFFVTSTGRGKGADLGGLAGADAHCQKLAPAGGARNRKWRAYLSTQASGNQPAVNARDRIGQGPWHNFKGELIAQNVADLHGDIERDRNNITKLAALSDKGEMINGRGDNPNRHDILTGSTSHGRAYTDTADHTCQNWTSSGAGIAQVGHHDRVGGGNTSWNSAHPSSGCSQENLASTSGVGLLYCFAAN